MKKNFLTTAILSAVISSTANAATVYENDDTTLNVGGRAEVRGLFSDSVDGSMEDQSRARINISGETQISESLTGFGFMEYEASKSSSVFDYDFRYLYAGFGTQIGDFSYGRQDTANVMISDMTDIASYHSGIQQIIDGASDKQSNTFLYSETFINALTVQLNYIAQDEKDNDAFAVSAAYKFTAGLELGASYSDQDEANQVTFGAGYTWNRLYVGTTYAMGDLTDNVNFTSLEFAAEYQFTNEFRLIGMIGMQEVDKVDTVDAYALEAQYRFNESIRTFASYKLDNLDDGENELVIGLRYDF